MIGLFASKYLMDKLDVVSRKFLLYFYAAVK